MKKKRSILLILLLVVILTACSAGANGSSATSDSTPATPGQPQPSQNGLPLDMATQPIEQKLAMGTLLLEDTENAITAEQAKSLLPLWKAVRSLSNSTTTADQEITGLYAQIQESMTAEQVQAIQAMGFSMEDTRGLMEKYGVQMPRNQGDEQLSDSERATRVAEFQSRSGNQNGGQAGGQFPGGGGFGGGMPPGGGMPGGMPSGGDFPPDGAFNGTPVPQGTQQPGQAGPGMRMGGMNAMFVEALINLLKERAGS